jgi:hypothetical protein
MYRWRKFANSLASRYYMSCKPKNRLLRWAGSVNYLRSANYHYYVADEEESKVSMRLPHLHFMPINMTTTCTAGEYLRSKPCATLVERLQALQDPVWRWAIKLKFRSCWYRYCVDRIVNGKREISKMWEEEASGQMDGKHILYVDYDQGIIVDFFSRFKHLAQAYNLTPYYTNRLHTTPWSQLNKMSRNPAGRL